MSQYNNTLQAHPQGREGLPKYLDDSGRDTGRERFVGFPFTIQAKADFKVCIRNVIEEA